MRKEFQINEFDNDGFLHSRIKNSNYNFLNKTFTIDMHAADLKDGNYITTCTLTITDWWDLEVYEYNRQETIKHFDLNNIPELDQIIKFSFDNEQLILTDFGLHNNTAIDYKFTKPKIQITGEYNPD